MKLKYLSTAAILATFATFQAAHANTDTGSLGVQVNVQANCSLSGAAMDFGSYISGQSTDLTAEGSITYANCPAGTLTFELASGQSNDVANRFMTDGSGQEQLSYQLYRTVTRNAVWGVGNDAQSVQLFASGGGSLIVYGTIPANQSVSSGTFTDTVAMTLTF